MPSFPQPTLHGAGGLLSQRTRLQAHWPFLTALLEVSKEL